MEFVCIFRQLDFNFVLVAIILGLTRHFGVLFAKSFCFRFAKVSFEGIFAILTFDLAKLALSFIRTLKYAESSKLRKKFAFKRNCNLHSKVFIMIVSV